MKNITAANVIELLESVKEQGITGRGLSDALGIETDQLMEIIRPMWDRGEITGVRSDACCGRGCAFMCVSYMEPEKLWVLGRFR